MCSSGIKGNLDLLILAFVSLCEAGRRVIPADLYIGLAED